MATNSLTGVLRETLALFESPGTPRTTSEIADELELGRRSTYDRLERLVDQERLRTKKVGANARVWWRPPTDDDIDTEDGHHQFHSLADAVEEYAIFLLDPDGYVKTWNHGTRQIKGYTEDEIVGEHFSTFYTDADRADNVPERNLRAAAQAGEIEDEGWRVRADGSRFWANMTITAIRDGDGDLEGFAKVTRDMTERHEHEDQLRQERNFTQRILETAPVGVVLLDEDGTFTSANQWADELLGLGDDGPHALEDNEVFDENGEPLPPSKRPYMQVFDSGEPVRNIQLNVPGGDSDRRWIAVNAEPLTADDGAVERVLVTVEDISQLKHQAERLQHERDQASSELDDVFERVDDAFFAIDDDWRFTYVNDTATEIVRLSLTDMLGSRVWDVLPEIADGRPRALVERAMATGEAAEFEFYSNLLEIWVEVRLYPAEDGLSVYFRDVTDRKEREHDLERYETLTQTASDGIVTIDTDSVIQDANPAVADVFGYEPSELVGESLTMLMPDRLTEDRVTAIQHYLDDGEHNIDWDYVELPGLHADGTEITLALSFSDYEHAGERYITAIIRDITERKEHERNLEEANARFQTIIENFPNGVIALVDQDLRYTTFGGTLEGDTEVTRDDLEGAPIREVLPTEIAEVVVPRHEAALEGELSSFEESIDGYHYHFHFFPVRDDDGEIFTAMAMSQDITDRKRSEHELERRIRQQQVVADLGRTALESADLDTLFADTVELVTETLDTDYCKVLDLDSDGDELLLRQGVGWDEGIVGAATVSGIEADSQAAYTLESNESVVVDDLTTESRFSGPDLLTDHDVKSGISVIIGSYDDPWGILGTHDTEAKEFSEHDVNFVQAVANILATAIERYEREAELDRQRETVRGRERAMREAYGVVADTERSFDEQIDALLDLVCETVDTDFATFSHVDGEEYRFEAVVAPPDADIAAGDVVPVSTTNCERVLETGCTLVLDDVDRDAPDLADRTGNAEWGISSYLGAPVVVGDDPYGTFCFYDMKPRTEAFSEWDVAFVELLSNWVSSWLARQRNLDRLAALNDLNQVLRELTTDAIEQPTRDEIERTVCEHLANSESYMFAWIGDVDTTTETVHLRTEAGVEGYLDGITISVDPDDERSQDPTERALRTGEIQVTNDIWVADHHDPWHEHIKQYGYKSSAAIPVVHDDTVYGALNVYADRPDAFGGDEQDVIVQLGEIVGHAIVAAERKQALMSDELVELDFRMAGILDEFGVSMPADEQITLDHAVSRGDDGFLVYGTATPGAVDTVHEIVATVDYWESVEFRNDGDPLGFELRMSDQPVLSMIASLGGYVEAAVVADGDFDLRVHFAPSVDVRQVIDAVEAAYPTADMRRKRQITRSAADPHQMKRELLADLTEKQRTTLEAAYHAGFFAWPRDVSGGEVADSLGVASPTFHQHLRKAEGKVFDSLLSAETPS